MFRTKMINVTALLATVGAVGTALGDFSNFVGQETLRYYAADGATITDFANAEYAVLDLYSNFGDPNTHGFDNTATRMLSIYDVNVQPNGFGLFYHNDLTGSGDAGAGNWKPSFSFDVPGTANPNIDSFVTIGGGVGALAATNVTTPDPNLGAATSPDILNANVGWFLNPPTSSQADVDGNLDVWIGRFVVTGDNARGGANFDFTGTASYNYGSGTGLFSGDGADNFTFVPAPGALAMLGIGGAILRRRRH